MSHDEAAADEAEADDLEAAAFKDALWIMYLFGRLQVCNCRQSHYGQVRHGETSSSVVALVAVQRRKRVRCFHQLRVRPR